MVEVYFTRPGTVCEISDRIINDIKYAKDRILIAEYYLTEHKIIEALNYNKISEKYFIFDSVRDNIPKGNIGYLGNGEMNVKMHHKFMIIDDILWIGSYNLSMSAKAKNWENCLRITDKSVIQKYEEEFWNMFLLAKCKVVELLNCGGRSNFECCECHNELTDPLLHYSIGIKIVSDIDEFWDNIDYDGVGCAVSVSEEKDTRIDRYNIICKEKVNIRKISCEKCEKIDYIFNLSKIDYYHNVTRVLHISDKDRWRIGDYDARPIIDECWERESNSKERIVRTKYLCISCLLEYLKGKFWKYE